MNKKAKLGDSENSMAMVPHLVKLDPCYLPRPHHSAALDEAVAQFQMGTDSVSDVDNRRTRRTISNRLSAQRSRTRKLQYIYEMEERVKILEAEIATLSPQVLFEHHNLNMLKMENHFLNQQIISCTENTMLKMGQLEENKAEVTRLRQLRKTQNEEKIQEQTSANANE